MSGYAVVNPQPQPNVNVYEQNYANNQQTNQDQYYYYYGGESGTLKDIAPSPTMVQDYNYDEQKMNMNYIEPLSSPQIIQDQLLKESPSSPALLYNVQQATYSMPIQSIFINTEMHIATAFVSMKITFQNTSNSKTNALFILPCNGTVTSTKVNINNGQRYLDTTFIDNEEAKQFQGKRKDKKKAEKNGNAPIDAYIPNLFRLPIADIEKDETVTIEVDYMENLQFVESRYHFYIPLNFANGILPNANPNCIQIKCSINCLTPGIRYGSMTHNLQLTATENLRSKLVATSKGISNNRDFHLFYSCPTNAISAALLCDEGSPYEYDPQQSFTCFVNPPTKMESNFARDIVFLLDRSGSMTGQPFADAVKGLTAALNTLSPYDRFGIVAFDHEQLCFDPQCEDSAFGNNDIRNLKLYQANKNTIDCATYFLNNTKARGMTNIKGPLVTAINQLNSNGSTNIPFVVLLTDGAVENEKEIVKSIKDIENNQTRVLTFGIGKFCNEYFLKMLSLNTRGWNEGCIYPKDLFPKIKLMMDRASNPILTDIQLEIPKNLKADIYPKTIPDLFLNGPIIISGKYTGKMPEQIVLKGKLQNGDTLSIPVRTDTSSVIPIDRVFIKQRMDQLNAEYWLTGNEKIKKQIVDISVNETFPSPYTSMIAYESTPKEKAEQDKDKKKKKKKGGGLSGGQIAALTGGAVVVGAGVFLLGNYLATGSNLGVMSVVGGGLGSAVGGIGDFFGSISCPCDACMDTITCGNIDCGDIANVFSCGVCGSCDGCLDTLPCGDCDGGCGALPGCAAIGGLCESCGEIFGGCFDSIGDICGGLCGACGNINIGDCCGDVGGCLGAVPEFMGDCCGAFTECAGELCGSIGDIFDALTDCLN